MDKVTRNNDIFSVTPIAAQKIKQAILNRDKPSAGIKVNVKQRGCSGNAYALEYVDTINSLDEVIDCHGIKIFVDPKALLFVLGTMMDYQETKLESGFKFINPNEKGRCGCGESFYV